MHLLSLRLIFRAIESVIERQLILYTKGVPDMTNDILKSVHVYNIILTL